MLAIQWDVATGDPDPHVSATRDRECDGAPRQSPARSSSSTPTGAAGTRSKRLPIAIPKLKAKGYKFVTVSELMTLGKPVIVSECYDRKPGDTKRYDFLSGLQHPLNPGSQNAAKLASAPIPTSKSTRSRVAARSKIPKSAGVRN